VIRDGDDWKIRMLTSNATLQRGRDAIPAATRAVSGEALINIGTLRYDPISPTLSAEQFRFQVLALALSW
jgi:hypothetical protein